MFILNEDPKSMVTASIRRQLAWRVGNEIC